MDHLKTRTHSGTGAARQRMVWSLFQISGFMRKPAGGTPGNSVQTLSRAEVLSLEHRLRAIVGQTVAPATQQPQTH